MMKKIICCQVSARTAAVAPPQSSSNFRHLAPDMYLRQLQNPGVKWSSLITFSRSFQQANSVGEAWIV